MLHFILKKINRIIILYIFTKIYPLVYAVRVSNRSLRQLLKRNALLHQAFGILLLLIISNRQLCIRRLKGNAEKRESARIQQRAAGFIQRVSFSLEGRKVASRPPALALSQEIRQCVSLPLRAGRRRMIEIVQHSARRRIKVQKVVIEPRIGTQGKHRLLKSPIRTQQTRGNLIHLFQCGIERMRIPMKPSIAYLPKIYSPIA